MIDENAVSVLPNDGGIDEFPVLKAFQQYIDAEQNKARKRLMILTAIFSLFMVIVVSVFVILLINVTQRNQSLNDRLVDFAMKQNQPAGSAVVVQPAQDNSALLQLTAKLEEMRKNFEAEKQSRAAEQKKNQAELEKAASSQDMEILRLKNLLQIQKERLDAEKEKVANEKAKAAAEKSRQKEIELEAYRRKHYPELYAPKKKTLKRVPMTIERNLDDNDDEPISYFDDDEDEDERPVKTPTAKTATRKKVKSVQARAVEDDDAEPYQIPVESIKPSRWRIPTE